MMRNPRLASVLGLAALCLVIGCATAAQRRSQEIREKLVAATDATATCLKSVLATPPVFAPGNIDLVISGMQGTESLRGADKLRFDQLMLSYFNFAESTMFSKTAFLLDDETMENWGYTLRTRSRVHRSFPKRHGDGPGPCHAGGMIPEGFSRLGYAQWACIPVTPSQTETRRQGSPPPFADMDPRAAAPSL